MSTTNTQCLNKHKIHTFTTHNDGYIVIDAEDEHGKRYTQRIEMAYRWDRCGDPMGDLLMALAVYGFSALTSINPGDRVYKEPERVVRPTSNRIVLPS